MAMTIASVASIWRYPGEVDDGRRTRATRLGEQGLIGDRSYALIDRATGKVASAKNPRKWLGIFKFSAALAAEPWGSGIPPVQITTPDGKRIISGTDEVDRVLSMALDREVTLQSQVPEALRSSSIGPKWEIARRAKK